MKQSPPRQPFDAEHAATYDERWAPLAPLRDSLHLQIGLILHQLPTNARVLCAGVGTGAELAMLAQRFPGWRFLACDPSSPMLDRCRDRAEKEGFADRCEFHAAYVNDLPEAEPYDAATALLVSHFIVDPQKRIGFFRDIATRLKPDGLLITADLCRVNEAQQDHLMNVWQQMMIHAGATGEQVEAMLTAYERDVSLVTPGVLRKLLTTAGFTAPVLFSQSLLIHAHFARRQA